MSHPALTTRPQWQALRQHFATLGQKHLRELFAADPQRGERLVVEDVGLYLDYSKQRVDADTLRLLRELAEACDLPRRIEAMRSEEHTSELQSLMRISYAVFCLKKKKKTS